MIEHAPYIHVIQGDGIEGRAIDGAMDWLRVHFGSEVGEEPALDELWDAVQEYSFAEFARNRAMREIAVSSSQAEHNALLLTMKILQREIGLPLSSRSDDFRLSWPDDAAWRAALRIGEQVISYLSADVAGPRRAWKEFDPTELPIAELTRRLFAIFAAFDGVPTEKMKFSPTMGPRTYAMNFIVSVLSSLCDADTMPSPRSVYRYVRG
ncbi:hypothetical protein N7I30_04500 [Aurantimonas litoralis]|nr:hypothetical protein [Aurantimonas litoralis]